MRACDVSLKGTFEGQMGLIADSLRENYFMIALSILVAIIAAYFVWLLANNILGIVRTYNRFTKKVDSAVGTSALKDKTDDMVQMEIANILGEDDSNAATGDDYMPAPASSDDALKEPTPESDSIKKKIAEIKSVYAAYNKEIANYSRDVQKEEPTDIMDERILSKQQDTY